MTSVRLRTDVHRYGMRVLEAIGHPPLMDPARYVGVRTLAVGRDPLRVLVFGGGIAVGYGVQSRQDALDGPLARMIAESTGRGVVIENRAVQHVHLPQTARSLGAAGTHTFHAAVWFPSFAEVLERIRLSGWRTELHAMIRELRTEERIPLILTGIPVPAGMDPAALIARPRVHRINRIIAEVAAEWDDVVAVETVSVVPAEIGKAMVDARYFEAVAERVASAVVSLVQPRTRATR